LKGNKSASYRKRIARPQVQSGLGLLMWSFLADHILTVALMLQCFVRLSLCLSSVCDVCIVAKRCVLEQKLLLNDSLQEVVCEESIGTKMNELDLCLEVV